MVNHLMYLIEVLVSTVLKIMMCIKIMDNAEVTRW